MLLNAAHSRERYRPNRLRDRSIIRIKTTRFETIRLQIHDAGSSNFLGRYAVIDDK